METDQGSILEGLMQFSLYEGALVIIGLIACLVALRRLPKLEQLGFPGTTPWLISVPDFILFICVFFLWYMMASTLAFSFSQKFTPEGDDPPGWALAIGNIILHGGIITLFWRWREMHRKPGECALNRARLGVFQVFGNGAFYFLVAYVLVIGSGLAWTYLLALVDKSGIPISFAPQSAIELFLKTEDALSLVLLGFVAVVAAPVAEELVFRGGIYRFLSGHLGKFSAAMATGLGFGFLHANLVGFIPLSIFGVFLCLVYEITGNLKVPMVVHALFNLNTLIMIFLSRGDGASG